MTPRKLYAIRGARSLVNDSEIQAVECVTCVMMGTSLLKCVMASYIFDLINATEVS